MRGSKNRPVPRGKRNGNGGFSYLEMVVVTLILALCAGMIVDTLSLGAKHLREQTKQSQAIMLLDTLSAVVRNDLFFARACHADGSFERLIQRGVYVRTWYGVGTWEGDWQAVHDWTEVGEARKGQIIRKSLLGSQEYYDLTTAPESYAGNTLCAAIRIVPNGTREIMSFDVAIEIYDDAKPLAKKEFTVRPIQALPYS